MAGETRKIDPPEVIGKRLFDERSRMMMTQEELAEALDCTENYIGQLERGSRKMSLAMAEKISLFFGISYDYLFCGVEPLSSAQMIREHANYEENAQIFSLLERCTPNERQICLNTLKALIKSLHGFRK